jgi:aryl-phospho-beta-D-glucosidase BglC (GH1 family)
VKVKKQFQFLILFLGFAVFTSCHKTDTVTPQLSISSSNVQLNANGDISDLTVTSNSAWSIISIIPDWLKFSQPSGNKGNTTLKISASPNTNFATRSATVSLAISGGTPVQITVSQASSGGLYPSYNTSPIPSDATGMNSTATQVAAQIKLGLNIGNTMEAPGGETGWGNPIITQSLIDLIKQNGFNAIRLPCAWDLHVDNKATAHISTDWLNRVKQVVQYCINDNMYVIVNIHWDGGWLEQNCTLAKKDSVNAKQKAFWEQIATELRDFDEHLLFASANEPNASNATQAAVLMSYHQTFINAVRSTGGKNSYRVLLLQAPNTSIDFANQYMTTLPADQVANKLMLEVHYYTPPNFCILSSDASWGKMFYYWGLNYHSTTDPTRNATFAEEPYVDTVFNRLKTNFVNKGIPVVMGEFAAVRRSNLTGDALTLHLESRAHFYRYVAQQAKANGVLPFLWDTGYTDGIFNRQNNTVFDQQALDSLKKGAGL